MQNWAKPVQRQQPCYGSPQHAQNHTRYTLLSIRDPNAVSVGPFLGLAVALLLPPYWWLDPNPPEK
jgi:hypothetical protein